MVHTSFPIVKKALSISNISFADNTNKLFVMCTAFNVSKSHKLSYLFRSTYATMPLEIIHSDVWSTPVTSKNGCILLTEKAIYQAFEQFKVVIFKCYKVNG